MLWGSPPAPFVRARNAVVPDADALEAAVRAPGFGLPAPGLPGLSVMFRAFEA